MKKIFLLFLVMATFFSLFKTNVQAEEQVYDPRFVDFKDVLNGITTKESNMNLEKWIPSSSKAIGVAIICEINGAICITDEEIEQSQTDQNLRNKLENYQRNSAMGFVNNMIIAMYDNPPASTSYYAYDVLHNAGFIPKAYAQGVGFSGLLPILDIWKAMRNISYMIILVVLIVIGFMIMFRMKINPQTAVSIQNALPNIVLTLILITFSYVIGGFLIDLMYFLILIAVSVFSNINGFDPSTIAISQSQYLNANTLTLMQSVINSDHVLALPKALWEIFIPGTVVGLGVIFFGGLPAIFTALTAGALPILIIVVALFFTFLRILFILISSYIQILINIIFAPIILLTGAIPGSNSFTSWIKNLLGNLIVFPTTAAIFLLSKTITSKISLTSGQSLWSPPFIAGPSADSDVLIALIGLGIALLAPSLILQIKQLLAPKPSLPVSPGLIIQPATSVIGKGIGIAQTYRLLGLGGPGFTQDLKNAVRFPFGKKPTESAVGKATQEAEQAVKS